MNTKPAPSAPILPRRPNFVDKEVVPIYAALLVGFCLFVAILLFGAGSMLGGLLFSSILIPVAFYKSDDSRPEPAAEKKGETPNLGYPSYPMSYLGQRLVPGAGAGASHSWLGHLMAGCLAGAVLSLLAGLVVVGVIFTALLIVLAYVFAKHPARAGGRGRREPSH
jgi:hypothetical protein